MAKSTKTPIPTIKEPNKGMLAWLNQQNKPATESSKEGNPLSTLTTDNPTNHKQEEPISEAVQETGNKMVEVPVGQPESIIPAQTGEEGKESVAKTIESTPLAVSRKSKSKQGDTSLSGKSYPETFFKKSEKSEDLQGSEPKLIRISEVSHWLLSVLSEEARRQGNKITVGDLIDNLLADHRENHKTVVDEMINNWKARKKFF
jgi:hypothetical protein